MPTSDNGLVPYLTQTNRDQDMFYCDYGSYLWSFLCKKKNNFAVLGN